MTSAMSNVDSVGIASGMENHVEKANEGLMSPAGYTGAAITLFFIGFLGFFLNLFAIVLMCKEKKLRTPINMILFNLVCSDFSVSILGNPFTLTSAIMQKWIFGNVMCVIYGFFMSLLGITSITTLTVLSFERYLMVSKPFKSSHLTGRTSPLIIAGIWLYSLALTIPPLFGWGEYVVESENISCSVNWQEQTYNTMTYIMFLFLFGLAVPVFVISFSYINIIRTMKQNTIRMGRVSKAESRVTFMVAMMIAAFLLAWTPYAVFALVSQFGEPGYISPALTVIPALLAKSSICYNPLIYVGLNAQFRSSWKRMFDFVGNELSGMENENTLAATRVFSTTAHDTIDGRRKCRIMQLSDIETTNNSVLIKLNATQTDGTLNKNEKANVVLLNEQGKTRNEIVDTNDL